MDGDEFRHLLRYLFHELHQQLCFGFGFLVWHEGPCGLVHPSIHPSIHPPTQPPTYLHASCMREPVAETCYCCCSCSCLLCCTRSRNCLFLECSRCVRGVSPTLRSSIGPQPAVLQRAGSLSNPCVYSNFAAESLSRILEQSLIRIPEQDHWAGSLSNNFDVLDFLQRAGSWSDPCVYNTILIP